MSKDSVPNAETIAAMEESRNIINNRITEILERVRNGTERIYTLEEAESLLGWSAASPRTHDLS